MDPEDAIPAAAAYLKAGGALDDWYAALFTTRGPAPRLEEVPDEKEEPQHERSVEDAPPDKETEPEERTDTEEEPTTGSETPPAADEATIEQYKY